MLISATEFKATCLELMDRVQQTGEEITITKHGKPLAKLAPIEPVHKAPGELFGCAKARLTILGDIVAPVEELVWNADEENVLLLDRRFLRSSPSTVAFDSRFVDSTRQNIFGGLSASEIFRGPLGVVWVLSNAAIDARLLAFAV